jgi:predicted dehydrogenase
VQILAAATLHKSPSDLRIYEHWDGLLEDKEIDLVAITIPPNLQAAIAEALMEAGKHVIIEKRLPRLPTQIDCWKPETEQDESPP